MNEFLKEYLQEHAQKVYGIHLEDLEELAAAFICRHGIDSADAQVRTSFDEETMTWTSFIERRPRGTREEAVSSMP